MVLLPACQYVLPVLCWTFPVNKTPPDHAHHPAHRRCRRECANLCKALHRVTCMLSCSMHC
jgi:hypothetical protein